MDVQSLQFGFSTVLSLVFGIAGAFGVWFKMKGDVKILELKLSGMSQDTEHAHERITNLKKEVERNKEKADTSTEAIKTEMQQMEIRIIQAIHEIKK